MQYRIASAIDVPAIEACRDEASGPADTRMAAYFQGLHHPRHALPPRTGFVALHEDQVIGYIAGHLTQRLHCEGEVQYLYVNPNYRRIGIASALLRRLADWFGKQNALRVCVNVDPDSPAAAPFYARHGALPLNKHWSIWEDIRTVSSGDELIGRSDCGLNDP